MKSIFIGTGSSVLSMAIIVCAATPVLAQRGREEQVRAQQVRDEHVRDVHVAAGVGSVRFGGERAPVRVVPGGVPGGAVRAEHYAVAAPRGAYSNPYRDDYFRRLPPGYRPIMLNGAQYYGYNSLPRGYTQVTLNGILHFLFGGVYYRPYIYGGQTLYVAVPPPV